MSTWALVGWMLGTFAVGLMAGSTTLYVVGSTAFSEVRSLRAELGKMREQREAARKAVHVALMARYWARNSALDIPSDWHRTVLQGLSYAALQADSTAELDAWLEPYTRGARPKDAPPTMPADITPAGQALEFAMRALEELRAEPAVYTYDDMSDHPVNKRKDEALGALAGCLAMARQQMEQDAAATLAAHKAREAERLG